MFRRSFLASAAALLTLPVAKLFGRRTIYASSLHRGDVVRHKHVLIDVDLIGVTLDDCTGEVRDNNLRIEDNTFLNVPFRPATRLDLDNMPLLVKGF
jgi:hypothetical protein